MDINKDQDVLCRGIKNKGAGHVSWQLLRKRDKRQRNVHLFRRLSSRILDLTKPYHLIWICTRCTSLWPLWIFSHFRHKLVLTLAAGDVKGRLLCLQPLLQGGDGKEHCSRDEDHCSGKVEARVIVSQGVVKCSCKELHNCWIYASLDRMTCHFYSFYFCQEKAMCWKMRTAFSTSQTLLALKSQVD